MNSTRTQDGRFFGHGRKKETGNAVWQCSWSRLSNCHGWRVYRNATFTHGHSTSNITHKFYVNIWLGWPCLRTKAQGPWHKGACFNFLPSLGGAFYTKSARRPHQAPGQFPNRLEVIHKNVSDWFYKWGVTSPPYTKTYSQKHNTLTSEGRRFRSSFSLQLKQI
jgi:hypothetical protein